MSLPPHASAEAALWRVARPPGGRLLRYRQDLITGADALHLPFTVRILWPYAAGVDGMPRAAALGTMDLFSGRLEAAAAESGVGLLAAETTGDGLREWVWLSTSAADMGGLVNAFAHAFPEVEADVEPSHDPDWHYFRGLASESR